MEWNPNVRYRRVRLGPVKIVWIHDRWLQVGRERSVQFARADTICILAADPRTYYFAGLREMCNSNELRAVSHSWEVGAKRSDMLIERQWYVGPEVESRWGWNTDPNKSECDGERGHGGIGYGGARGRGAKGSSVCNSPRWCEAMRCDRSAMSCGRPDGPAAVPCLPELSARHYTGSSYRLCLFHVNLRDIRRVQSVKFREF